MNSNPLRENAKDFWTGLIYVAIGGAALVLGRDYGMGSAVRMGPAYFPAILGGLLVLIGLVSIARSFWRRGTPVGRVAWSGLALIVAATVAFGLLARGAGLAVAVPVMMLLGASASARFRWPQALFLAAGGAIFCILVFALALGVPLPIFGPWLGG